MNDIATIKKGEFINQYIFFDISFLIKKAIADTTNQKGADMKMLKNTPCKYSCLTVLVTSVMYP